MATEKEVYEVVNTMVTLNLRPVPSNPVATVKAYAPMLRDIPGAILAQAATNHAMSSAFFPSVAELREAAALAAVQAQPDRAELNAKPGYPAYVKPVYPVMIVTPDGWEAVDLARPARHASIYPPEVLHELEAIEQRTGAGLLSDADFARVEAITAPYLQGQLCTV